MTRVMKPHMWPKSFPARADEAQAAPHRYTWDGDLPNLDDFGPGQWQEMMAAVPYQPGDVVYVDRGGDAVKALIIDVWVRRSDWDGRRRPTYRVVMATAKGTWSKLWEKTHPGFIQRGYVAAGLAPDCEGKL